VRLLLKFIAAVMILYFLGLMIQLPGLLIQGRLAGLVPRNIEGALLVLGWLALLLLGPIASIRLWYLQPQGLVLTVLLLVLLALYDLAQVVFEGDAAVRQQAMVRFAFKLASCVLLLSPAARRVCATGETTLA
jgi:hypothetical protein